MLAVFRRFFQSTILISLLIPSARAETLQEFLRDFHADPALMMRRLPSEVLEDGRVRTRSFIDEDELEDVIEFKDRTRLRVLKNSSNDLQIFAQAGVDPHALAAKLVENGSAVANLADLEQRRLTGATLSRMPWNDSYWPLYKGMTGRRYADPSFPDSNDWSVNRAYVQQRPASAVFASRDRSRINALSPAEKYDIAVGDYSYGLTNYAWNQGQKYSRNGRVARWMGICHGWAAAASMLARFPSTPVTVTSANGYPILFYPQDVKALQSMLWANANVPTRFIGSRCNVSKPARNGNGRIIDPKCFDVDPGTWHIAVANQLGRYQRSFVMDSTFDLEVWNFPIVSYRLTYFNPQNWKESSKLSSSVIRMNQFGLDKFREFRSSRATYVVGIKMDVSHLNAIEPTRSNSNKPSLKTVRYIYDLELDGAMNIVGGEWYSNIHPDFLWTYNVGRQAIATGESKILSENWSPFTPVPMHWGAVAQKASARGQPLFALLRQLGSVEYDDMSP